MTDVQQRRLLSGTAAFAGGVPNPGPTTIHTLNDVDEDKGGPYLEEITLWVSNTNVAARDITITTPQGVISVNLPADSGAIRVLDGIPFLATTTNRIITITTTGGDCFAWGWFVCA